MNIVDMIKRENRLIEMCAEVFGSENAKANAKRLASRYENDFREIAGILILMRSVK